MRESNEVARTSSVDRLTFGPGPRSRPTPLPGGVLVEGRSARVPYIADLHGFEDALPGAQGEVFLGVRGTPRERLQRHQRPLRLDCGEIQGEGLVDGPQEEPAEGPVSPAIRLVERPVVPAPVLDAEDDGRVPGAQEDEVRGEAGGPAVPVHERVDEREAVVEINHPKDGIAKPRELIERVVEQGDDLPWRRGDMGRSGDPDLFLPIPPRPFEDPPRHDLVEGPDCLVVHTEARPRLSPDPIVRLGVVRRLQVLPEALPSDRDALLKNQAGFLQGEGVPLDRVAVVRVRDAELLPEPGDDVLRERLALPDRPVIRLHALPDHGREVRRGYRYRHVFRLTDTSADIYRYRLNFMESDTSMVRLQE